MPFHYKFYAVRVGRETGVFHDIWPNIEPLVSGYSGAYVKAFHSEQEADDFMQEGDDSGSYSDEGAGFLRGDNQRFIIEFDGASRRSSGYAGCGALLVCPSSGDVLLEAGEQLPNWTTSNVAEYEGAILGLREALYLGAKHVQVQGDSQLVLNQVQGAWRVSKQHLKELVDTARDLCSQFTSVHFAHIRRSYNVDADRLANQAIDEGSFRNLLMDDY